MKQHEESYLIGELEFSDIINENEVGGNSRFSIRKIGQCKIEVYSGEGQIPHFHITGIAKKFNCCVRIYDAHFFSHGNKYRDILNATQCMELNTWLKEINPKVIPAQTNWVTIRNMWELANPDCKFSEKLKVKEQPDYTKMTMFRDEQ